MRAIQDNQTIAAEQGAPLSLLMQSFLTDCEVRKLSPNSIRYYRSSLGVFARYAALTAVAQFGDVTPQVLRGYLAWLDDGSRQPGGIHAHYRVVKAFTGWVCDELDLGYDANPMRKVRGPKVPHVILEPVAMDTVAALLSACGTDAIGLRDRAMILCMLDTGARAGELCSLNIDDLSLMRGSVLIRHGKGGKARTVYFGSRTRKAIRAYLYARQCDCPALFVNRFGERLTYWGLALMLKRRAGDAGVGKAPPHSFRRAFALSCLRSGMNVFALRELMGHASDQVLQRYLRLTEDDAHDAHARYGPVDNDLAQK